MVDLSKDSYPDLGRALFVGSTEQCKLAVMISSDNLKEKTADIRCGRWKFGVEGFGLMKGSH